MPETTGVAGGYRLGAGAALPPLLLDDEEAVAVAVSLRTAASQPVTGIAESSLRALAKLQQVLPARLRDAAAALRQATVALPRAVAALVDPDLLTLLALACRGRDVLDFGYVRRDGTATRRQAEPYLLVQARDRWYLRPATHRATGDRGMFWADPERRPPAATGARFTRVDPPDAAAFVADAITAAPYQFRARVVVHAPVQVIAERVPPNSAALTAEGPEPAPAPGRRGLARRGPGLPPGPSRRPRRPSWSPPTHRPRPRPGRRPQPPPPPRTGRHPGPALGHSAFRELG